MVLPGLDRENAGQRAEKFRRGIRELTIYHMGKPLPQCTVSLGVAVCPENGAAAEPLLKAADDAMYRAKNEGRDRVVLA